MNYGGVGAAALYLRVCVCSISRAERIMVAIETKEAQELAPLRSRLASILLSCLLDTLPDIAERAEKSIEVVANTWLSASKDNDAAASVADLEVVPAEDRSSSAVVSRAYIGALVSEVRRGVLI